MKKLFSFFTLLFFVGWGFAQIQPAYTPANQRVKAFEQRNLLKENSIINNIPFRNIGPSVISGRVVDVSVSPKDPSHFYVAYASGGLWKTTNNGTSFTPIFEKEAVMTIGDIAVDWDRNIIWVGTGENNSSRSSYAGVGMYKSEDGGKTWMHKGLEESHHIGRIIRHPSDPNTLWVAALGHLYSANKERGIYKTIDGGTTWQKVLFVDENTGGVELTIDPNNSNILYAGLWHRERRAWNFVEAGKGSGIYKSTDGGTTWIKMNTEKSGFPVGEGVGRIGLAVHPNGGSTTIYAILDNYFRRDKKKEEAKDSDALVKDDLRDMDKASFLNLKKEKLTAFLKANRFPKKYTAAKVIEMVKSDKIKPLALVEFLEDANSLLFDTPVKGAEVYKSTDGGKTWAKTHDGYLNGLYYSYGYYFGQIRVAPDDVNKIYIFGVPIIRSDDGGKTFKNIHGDNVHADHHALYVNPNRSGHLILGNDGGINISYDDGEHWNKCNTPPLGQFYYIAVDLKKPYNVYGGMQDNGVWMGPSTYKASTSWHGSGHYPYKSLLGGDGMQVAVDTRDNETVYTGFQFGNYFRVNTRTGKRKYITPKHELGDRPLRWNWQAPILISPHNQDIIYFGSNKLHRSMNQGDEFTEISGDLTTGGKKGDVAFSTLTTIHESPLKFGLIYVGTDDGLIHVSKDGGNQWEQITTGLPEGRWVARVWASAFEEGRVYAALNGYRWDEFVPYVYQSDDYGKTWTSIAANLPNEPINVIKEDPKNENLIYVGTDHGLYVSLDRGNSYMLMDKNLPAVAIHDVVVHPTANDLLVGTHGRSIYLANIEHLQALNADVLDKELHAFSLKKIRSSSRWGTRFNDWAKLNTPEMKIPFYAKNGGKMTAEIKSKGGINLKTISIDASKGLNYAKYDLTLSEKSAKALEAELNKDKKKDGKTMKIKKAKDNQQYYLPKGKYTVLLQKNGEKVEKELVIQ
jgi:photosystem II stability/assembly factor-like uncharacterized protein